MTEPTAPTAVPLPWGAAVGHVRALARDVAAEGTRIGQTAPRVDDATVARWIGEGAARVAARVPAWSLLLPESDPYAAGKLTREAFSTLAASLAELWAAALLADVTHPERVQSGKGYGEALLKRFAAGLDELRADVDTALPGPQGGAGPTPGAAAVFPPPRIRMGMGF